MEWPQCSDPRYCPPECDLGPPTADGESEKVAVEKLGEFWAQYQPSSFDVYSAGVVLMQVRRAKRSSHHIPHYPDDARTHGYRAERRAARTGDGFKTDDNDSLLAP